jgi:1-phosphofructokinase
VLIATPNLCVDRTSRVPPVVPGGVLRASSVEVTAGGKGVNVARVARAHGHRATVVALAASRDRDRLLGLLADEGAEVVAVDSPGYARVGTIMVEESGRATVLNEPGTEIDELTWARYRDAVAERLDGARLLVGAGSLPPGAPVDGYHQLIGLAAARGVPTVLDTSPAPLRAALTARPELVTPNLEEAEAALRGGSGALLVAAADPVADGAGADVAARADEAARALCALGAQRAAVTAGAAGVAFSDGVRTDWVRTVQTRVVSAVGAGDSFVGGLALGLLESDGDARAPGQRALCSEHRYASLGRLGYEAWLDAVIRGAATATASCERLLAGGVDPARAAELLAELRALAAKHRDAGDRRAG